MLLLTATMGSMIIEMAENAKIANRKEVARTPRRALADLASPLSRNDVN